MRLLPLAFALALTSLSAQAASPQAIAEDFRSYAADLPTAALNAGYRSFGHLNLSQFLLQLQNVDVRVAKTVVHKQSTGTFKIERDGAEWTRGGGITVNGSRWPKTATSAKPMLAFHEALGALGVEDDNFGCSTSIWALTDPEVRASFSGDEVATYERNAHAACAVARGGSSTGVTGGGDDYNVIIRMKAIKQGVQKMHGSSTSAERRQNFNEAQGLAYQGWGINRRGKIFEPKEAGRINRMERHCDPATIRVFADLELQQPIPQNAKNGWTYDARQNAVIIHGRYIPKMVGGELIGTPILCTYLD